MSFSCASCGYRNAEVKGGGAVPLKGCRATLKCVDEGDLLRDVLKSDTAAVTIPELDLELVHGTLGSVYTTLEGCLGDGGQRRGVPPGPNEGIRQRVLHNHSKREHLAVAQRPDPVQKSLELFPVLGLRAIPKRIAPQQRVDDLV